jgi:uncharacterized membrane protein (UPF0136 family)
MIELTKYYYYLFGLFSIVGGVMGYVRKGSLDSIVAGGISGALLIFAGYLAATKVQPALILGLLISLALGSRFIYVYSTKGGFMPAGLMSLLSIIGVVLTLITLFSAGKR